MSYEESLQRIEDWITKGNPKALLNLSECNLTRLPPIPPNVKNLDISRNHLNSLAGVPPSVTMLRCCSNELCHLYDLPPKLRYLDCAGNQCLKSIDSNVDSIVVLNCSYCRHITEIIRLPNELICLITKDCYNLRKIKSLPPNLQTLNCEETCLRTLPPLPESLTMLWCLYSHIRYISAFPKSLKCLNLMSNRLRHIPPLPPSLESCDLWGLPFLKLDKIKFPDSITKLSTYDYDLNRG